MTLFRTLIAALVLAFSTGDLAAAEKPLTVIELYTSQGCSSCPPADAYLAELAQLGEKSGLLPLSFHVDYWNYLGWEDPYSSAVYSQRQSEYARYFDSRNVYTPQMVIQGVHQVVGSNRSEVRRAITAVMALPQVTMVVTSGTGGVTLALPATSLENSAKVLVVMYDNEHLTAVKRGENRGKKISNRNVVRKLTHVADWDGKAQEIQVSYVGADGDKGAVLLQSAKTGAILGAATFTVN